MIENTSISRDHRRFMAWAELVGILHDIGKLSKTWLNYRQNWQNPDNEGFKLDGNGQNKWHFGNDPHERWPEPEFGYPANELSKTLRKALEVQVPAVAGPKETDAPSILKAILVHANEEASGFTVTKLLKLADSIDSAYDRNNPRFCNEQNSPTTIQDTEVFGWESNVGRTIPDFPDSEEDIEDKYFKGFPPAPHAIDVDRIDEARKTLLRELDKDIAEYFGILGLFSNSDDMSGPPPDESKPFDSKEIETIQKLRTRILGSIRWAFDEGLSDTTRPSNDTTLWEHCYSVASLLKAACGAWIHDGNPFTGWGDFEFKLLTVSWDGVGYISSSRRLGETVGRERIIHDIRRKVRNYVEWDILAGNEVYWDINHMVFLVPASCGAGKSNDRPFGWSCENLATSIQELFFHETEGDLIPSVCLSAPQKELTAIKDELSRPVGTYAPPVHSLTEEQLNKLNNQWGNTKSNWICPSCHRRPVSKKKTLCTRCRDIRAKAADLMSTGEKRCNTTVFQEEISNANLESGQIALAIVHFGLDNWLDGSLVRSMFVTELDGINRELELIRNSEPTKLAGTPADSQKTQEFKQIIDYWKTNNQTWENYDRLQREAGILFDGENSEATKRMPLFVAPYWTAQKDLSKIAGRKNSDDIFRVHDTCAKTPTPSTILDTWGSTQGFITDQLTNDGCDGCNRKKAQRCIIQIRSNSQNSIVSWSPIKCEPRNKQYAPFEIVVVSKAPWIEAIAFVDTHKADQMFKGGLDVIISSEEEEFEPLVANIVGWREEDFLPERIIALSPRLGMLLMPGDRALGFVKQVKENYDMRFGKVSGRLPLNIGLLFFNAKYPMYLVLDAAHRMIDGFDEKLQPQASEVTVLDVSEDSSAGTINLSCRENASGRTFESKIPVRLANGNIDHMHPYLLAKDDGDLSSRPSYFKVPNPSMNAEHQEGDEKWVVISPVDVQKGDVLTVFPNRLDFEFLDTFERRLDIAYDKFPGAKGPCAMTRRSLPHRFTNKPYFLEEFDQFSKWWDRLGDGSKEYFGAKVTTTQIRQLESLWASTLQEWDVDISKPESSEFMSWKAFVRASLKNAFPALKKDDDDGARKLQETLDAVTSGLLLDLLELNLHVLKQKPPKRKSDNGE